MTARYVCDESEKHIGLQLVPKGMTSFCEKNEKLDSLVQFKIAGDIYDEAYAMGNSMRNGETVRRLELAEQNTCEEDRKTTIKTILKDDRGNEVKHFLTWLKDRKYVEVFCEYTNNTGEDVKLEMFESFSLCGLSPFLEGDGHNCLNLHRIRSVWSQEGRLECIPIEDLQLEPAWEPHAVRCEKFGQVGSMPVNKFFPFVAIEDTKNNVFWGAQIAHNASWQMELYRKDDALCLSGGLGDRDFAQWLKTVRPGERFETPKAILSAANTDNFDIFTNRLIDAAVDKMGDIPESEQDLPIIFNEYCTTWGNPSHENISEIVDVIKDKGFSYFVIDCGWYKQPDIPWDISMGDYDVSKELFPDGLKKTAAKIKSAGMVPGIWFEIDNVGKAARSYQNTDHLLKKDGKPLTSYFRRFWDMTDPWVQNYLTEKVIGTLKEYDFGYMKIDYNETIGAGCDHEDSLGEGLRQNMAASSAFIDKVKDEVPGIVLENCSSGGHRLEPGFMGQMSMASFSDAHECVEIPIIAADLHRVIHPRQSQIWAVIHKDDSLRRICYSVANTFLGRMCISGDVTNLSQEQWGAITDGMEFYKSIAPIIKDGQSCRFGSRITSTRHPEGWQALLRTGKNGEAFVVLHSFGGKVSEQIIIDLPADCPDKIARCYTSEKINAEIKDGKLYYSPKDNWTAIALHLV